MLKYNSERYITHKSLQHTSFLQIIDLVNQSTLSTAEKIDILDTITYLGSTQAAYHQVEYWKSERLKFLEENYLETSEYSEAEKGYLFKVSNSCLNITKLNSAMSDSVIIWLLSMGFRHVKNKNEPEYYSVKLSKVNGDGPQVLEQLKKQIRKSVK